VQGFTTTSQNTTQPKLEDIFNITNFEYLLGTGVPPTSQKGNFPDRAILQQQSQIKNYGITWPNSNMVGFAVGLSVEPIEEWSNPAILQRVFQRAHQLLFVSAFSTLSTTTATLEDLRPGSRKDSPGAIIFVRSISIAVEISLGIIIVFIACLFYYSHQRAIKLQFDPASIAHIMSMVHPSGELSHEMHDNGTLTSKELEGSLSTKTYTLECTEDGTNYIRPSQKAKKLTLSATSKCSSFENSSKELRSSPVQPLELRLLSGLVFITILIAAIVAIIILYLWSLKNDGKCRSLSFEASTDLKRDSTSY